VEVGYGKSCFLDLKQWKVTFFLSPLAKDFAQLSWKRMPANLSWPHVVFASGCTVSESVSWVWMEQCQDRTGSWLSEHASACRYQWNSSVSFLKNELELWFHVGFSLHLPRVLPLPITDGCFFTFTPALEYRFDCSFAFFCWGEAQEVWVVSKACLFKHSIQFCLKYKVPVCGYVGGFWWPVRSWAGEGGEELPLTPSVGSGSAVRRCVTAAWRTWVYLSIESDASSLLINRKNSLNNNNKINKNKCLAPFFLKVTTTLCLTLSPSTRSVVALTVACICVIAIPCGVISHGSAFFIFFFFFFFFSI